MENIYLFAKVFPIGRYLQLIVAEERKEMANKLCAVFFICCLVVWQTLVQAYQHQLRSRITFLARRRGFNHDRLHSTLVGAKRNQWMKNAFLLARPQDDDMFDDVSPFPKVIDPKEPPTTKDNDENTSPLQVLYTLPDEPISHADYITFLRQWGADKMTSGPALAALEHPLGVEFSFKPAPSARLRLLATKNKRKIDINYSLTIPIDIPTKVQSLIGSVADTLLDSFQRDLLDIVWKTPEENAMIENDLLAEKEKWQVIASESNDDYGSNVNDSFTSSELVSDSIDEQDYEENEPEEKVEDDDYDDSNLIETVYSDGITNYRRSSEPNDDAIQQDEDDYELEMFRKRYNISPQTEIIDVESEADIDFRAIQQEQRRIKAEQELEQLRLKNLTNDNGEEMLKYWKITDLSPDTAIDEHKNSSSISADSTSNNNDDLVQDDSIVEVQQRVISHSFSTTSAQSATENAYPTTTNLPHNSAEDSTYLSALPIISEWSHLPHSASNPYRMRVLRSYIQQWAEKYTKKGVGIAMKTIDLNGDSNSNSNQQNRRYEGIELTFSVFPDVVLDILVYIHHSYSDTNTGDSNDYNISIRVVSDFHWSNNNNNNNNYNNNNNSPAVLQEKQSMLQRPISVIVDLLREELSKLDVQGMRDASSVRLGVDTTTTATNENNIRNIDVNTSNKFASTRSKESNTSAADMAGTTTSTAAAATDTSHNSKNKEVVLDLDNIDYQLDPVEIRAKVEKRLQEEKQQVLQQSSSTAATSTSAVNNKHKDGSKNNNNNNNNNNNVVMPMDSIDDKERAFQEVFSASTKKTSSNVNSNSKKKVIFDDPAIAVQATAIGVDVHPYNTPDMQAEAVSQLQLIMQRTREQGYYRVLQEYQEKQDTETQDSTITTSTDEHKNSKKKAKEPKASAKKRKDTTGDNKESLSQLFTIGKEISTLNLQSILDRPSSNPFFESAEDLLRPPAQFPVQIDNHSDGTTTAEDRVDIFAGPQGLYSNTMDPRTPTMRDTYDLQQKKNMEEIPNANNEKMVLLNNMNGKSNDNYMIGAGLNAEELALLQESLSLSATIQRNDALSYSGNSNEDNTYEDNNSAQNVEESKSWMQQQFLRVEDRAVFAQESQRFDMLIRELTHAPVELYEMVLNGFRDVLLSDHCLLLLKLALAKERRRFLSFQQEQQEKQNTENVVVDGRKDEFQDRSFIYTSIANKAASLHEELMSLIEEESVRHYQTIAEICDISTTFQQSDPLLFLDRLDALKPKFDTDLLAFVNHHIYQEENKLSRHEMQLQKLAASGTMHTQNNNNNNNVPLLSEQEEAKLNRWVMVLRILRQGIMAEMERRYEHPLEMIDLLVRIKEPQIRLPLFARFVAITPPTDLYAFRTLAVNTVERLLDAPHLRQDEVIQNFWQSKNGQPNMPNSHPIKTATEWRIMLSCLRKEIEEFLSEKVIEERMKEYQQELATQGVTVAVRHRNPLTQFAMESEDRIEQRQASLSQQNLPSSMTNNGNSRNNDDSRGGNRSSKYMPLI